MKTKVLVFLTLFTLVSCTSNAQEEAIEEVKKVIESYKNAGDINDASKLEPHLHDAFRVVLYDGKKSEASVLDKATYISFIATKKFGGYKRTATYHDIQFIEKNMVTVKVTLKSPGKPTLKNFYSLVKIKNKWLVIQDYVTLLP
ncbi:nuclear transport factor 2 family protein [Flavobacterium sp. ASW18X]|uniref:nuclear transport factor 2 family protein n=1 Tax=Flavobacterium sp. ASW18X TaxID=2572595 RepID=UPI0010ADBE76|nr:nuclear transport factor 2 family protein [Flavobacterium sp. ASW18X]TKD57932.1 hypothetical protein FBT53_15115 [Flavobacterium sp. ASW18X]